MALTQVSTNGIKDATIATADIADDAVIAAKIADNAVVTAAINADAVTGAKIADDAVGAEHIEDLDSHVKLLDNSQAIFGTGSDLRIYHDGTRSWIADVNTGNLIIDTNGAEIDINSGGNAEYMGRFIKDGAVELYYDNAKKFETTSSGATLSGYLNVPTGDSGYGSSFGDSVKAGFGNVSDLQIYHDGTDSYIKEAGVGELQIWSDTNLALRSDAFRLNNAANDENMIKADANGAVELYYDNTVRLATNANGIEVNGHVWLGDGEHVKFGSDTNGDLQIYHNGTDNYIKNVNGAFKLLMGSEYALTATANGSVDLYYDDSKKLETRDAGVNTLGNHYVMDDNFFGCGDGADLQIKHSATGNLSSITHSGAGKFDIVSTGDDLNIKSSENVVLMTNDTEIGVYVIKNGTVKLYHDGTEQCYTSANGLAFPSGKGIDFSATGGPTNGSGTQELLDDYEEGTWTPAYGTYGGDSGTKTHSAQNGFFVKIGCIVHAYFDFNVSSWSGATGTGPTIYGFPFTKNVLGSQSYYYFGLTVWHVSNEMSGSKSNFSGYMSNGETHLRTYASDTAAQSSVAPMNVTGRISGCVIYTTSS